MIQLLTRLNVADNSGAKSLLVIGVPGRVGKKATVGHVIRCSVKGADPAGNVKNKEVVDAVIVRTRKEVGRKDGTYVRFDDNAAVVIDKQGMPRGTRVLGPIGREVKDAGFAKIASLAKEVI